MIRRIRRCGFRGDADRRHLHGPKRRSFVEFLYGARADVIAFCTNWLEEGLDLHSYWRFRLLLSRSVFVAANTYGSEVCRGHDATEFAGQSAIFDSRGRTLAKAPPAGDALISAEVRLSR